MLFISQVDAALEYALEHCLKVRPPQPLKLVAKKLREWDEAVNGEWALRAECEAVFSKLPADATDGLLDVTKINAALQSTPKTAELMPTDLNIDLGSKVSLADWLLAFKANADTNAEATKAVLGVYASYRR